MTGVGAFPHRPRRTFQGAIADRLDGAYATMSAAGPVNGPWDVCDGGYGQSAHVAPKNRLKGVCGPFRTCPRQRNAACMGETTAVRPVNGLRAALHSNMASFLHRP